MTLAELTALLTAIPTVPPVAIDIVWNNGGVVCFQLNGVPSLVSVAPPVSSLGFMLEDGSGRWLLEDGSGAWVWG
jgi:hypothetical protein